jgi:hypothetical protein
MEKLAIAATLIPSFVALGALVFALVWWATTRSEERQGSE